jgi:transcriptional regulator with XRE-family HTH domain
MVSRAPAKASYHYRLRPEIRRELARLNLSQNTLARRAGVSSGFMSQLLTGRRFAGPETRQKIMDCLPKLNFDQLFEEKGAEAPAVQSEDALP